MSRILNLRLIHAMHALTSIFENKLERGPDQLRMERWQTC